MSTCPETVAEALEVWDSGQPIQSISMGGISDAYEQSIQNLASVVCRRGYRAAVSMPEVADRIITVRRNGQ